MWRSGVFGVGVIALAAALGLASGIATPDPALAGSVQGEGQRTWSGGYAWSHGDGRWGDGRRWQDGRDGRGWDGWRWGDHQWGWGSWGGPRPYWGWWGPGHAPAYVPPRWVWDGWQWVLVPGHWR